MGANKKTAKQLAKASHHLSRARASEQANKIVAQDRQAEADEAAAEAERAANAAADSDEEDEEDDEIGSLAASVAGSRIGGLAASIAGSFAGSVGSSRIGVKASVDRARTIAALAERANSTDRRSTRALGVTASRMQGPSLPLAGERIGSFASLTTLSTRHGAPVPTALVASCVASLGGSAGLQPSPVQAEAWGWLLSRAPPDLVAISSTGSGKTRCSTTCSTLTRTLTLTLTLTRTRTRVRTRIIIVTLTLTL